MARPVIALLTDFGLQDHYVGVMKGVMLGICPDAQLVDITHETPPQDVIYAAVTLDAAYRYFPPGTVFLCVVDPGVGSARRGIAAAVDGYQFVGPDNGLFSLVMAGGDSQHTPHCVELRSAAHRRPDVSRTFEGRDRFAPAAAWLAGGARLDDLGPRIDRLITVDLPAPRVSARVIDGEVIAVDRYGNLITNIGRTVLPANKMLQVSVTGRSIPHLVDTYAEVPIGAACALIGSADRLEIAVRNGSAAARFGVGTGAAIQVRTVA